MNLLELGKTIKSDNTKISIFKKDCTCEFDGNFEQFKKIYGNNIKVLKKSIFDIYAFKDTLFITLKTKL